MKSRREVNGFCPSCQRTFEVELERLRRSFRCPLCGASLEDANLAAPNDDAALDVALERLRAVLRRRGPQS